MILNSGLDFACTTDSGQVTSPADQTTPFLTKFVRFACFGTGSTAPAAADTTLDAQVGSRTNNNGGFADTVQQGADAGTNTLWYEATITRTFAISGNVNATEWGLAPAATGNLSVRELFRTDPLDNNSSPITLTLENGDQLQLVVTLRVEAAWEYETKTFTITGTLGNDGNGTHEGNAALTHSSGSGGVMPVGAFRRAWPGGYNTPGAGSELAASTTDQTSVTITQNLTNLTANVVAAAETYTPGDYYRDYVAVFSTAVANGDHYAWIYGQPAFGLGLRFILTDPPYLTKTSTHRLTLTVRKHISRL